MIRQPTPADAPSAAFASLHPALAALETAMSNVEKAKAESARAAEVLQRAYAKADPTAWTAKIEAARANGDEMAKLRIIYDEEALIFMSAFINYKLRFKQTSDAHQALHCAITEALIAYEDIQNSRRDTLLARMFEPRIVKAIEVSERQSTAAPDLHFGDQFVVRTRKIQTACFEVFLRQLPSLAGQRPYSKDCVIDGHKFGYNRDVDLRKVYPVDFVDCVNSKHPFSERLATLLVQVDPILSEAWQAEKALKGDQNGRVNERQHAYRLLEYLHSDGSPLAAYHCGGNIDDQVRAQNARRLDYEHHRLALLAQTRKLRGIIEEVVGVLQASAQETKQLAEEVMADQRATIDKIETAAIMVNNCLAADARLRRWCACLTSLEQVGHNDLSAGAGSRLAQERLQELRKTFDYSVKKRRQEMNGDKQPACCDPHQQ